MYGFQLSIRRPYFVFVHSTIHPLCIFERLEMSSYIIIIPSASCMNEKYKWNRDL